MSVLEHLDKFNESPDESHNIVKRNSEIEIVDEENVEVFDEAIFDSTILLFLGGSPDYFLVCTFILLTTSLPLSGDRI